jgi:hypothetical protein
MRKTNKGLRRRLMNPIERVDPHFPPPTVVLRCADAVRRFTNLRSDEIVAAV